MRLPVHVWITERNAEPEELAGYLAEIARRMDESPRRMCIVVESSVQASLDVDPSDGNLVAKVAGSESRFSLRRRWLPEHPVPLEFGPSQGVRSRRTVLLADPTSGNRFRVRSCRAFGFPAWAYALLAASASVAAVTFNGIAVVFALSLLASIALVGIFPRVCAKFAGLFWTWRCRVRFPAENGAQGK